MIVKDDVAIERIREVRHKISAEFGHDPKLLVDHYAELEKRYNDRMERESTPAREPLEIVKQ